LGVAAALGGCSDPAIVKVEVNLQKGPASESAVLAVIPKGSAIKVGSCDNGWCRVSWNGRDGYILTKSMRLTGRAHRNTAEDGSPDDQEADANAPAPDEATAPVASPD
jgi:uncharacterized protein YraI